MYKAICFCQPCIRWPIRLLLSVASGHRLSTTRILRDEVPSTRPNCYGLCERAVDPRSNFPLRARQSLAQAFPHGFRSLHAASRRGIVRDGGGRTGARRVRAVHGGCSSTQRDSAAKRPGNRKLAGGAIALAGVGLLRLADVGTEHGRRSTKAHAPGRCRPQSPVVPISAAQWLRVPIRRRPNRWSRR